MVPAVPETIGVLVADSNQSRCELLAGALRRRPGFQVTACRLEMEAVMAAVAAAPVAVAVMNLEHPREAWQDMTAVRRLHLSYPQIAIVLILDTYDRELVVNAFRSGACGLFCCADSPVRLLSRCIQSVHRGQVWANSRQLRYLLDVVSQVPSLRMVNATGDALLTPRESQVAALVADGLTNREVGEELRISEHTVKKYLLGIFDKLGISTRVELVLYAVNHGNFRQAEWMAGAASPL